MLLYISVMLQPLLPIATDWYGHEFNPIQHQIQIHMVYGSHHLYKDVADSNWENSKTNKHTSIKTSETAPVHIAVQNDYIIPQPTPGKQKFATFACNIYAVSLNRHFNPPRPC